MRTVLIALFRTLSATALALMLMTVPADALNWTNTLGGLWETAGNWNPNQQPGPTDAITLTQNGTYTVIITNSTADSNPSTMTISQLSIANGAGDYQQLLINYTNSAVSLSITNTGVSALTVGGANSAPRLDILDGSVDVAGAIKIGNGAGAEANAYLSGTLDARSSGLATFALGYLSGSTGRLVVAGGSLYATNAGSFFGVAPQSANAYGQLIVSNGLVATAGGNFAVGRSGGKGEIQIYGGEVRLNSSTAVGDNNGTGSVLVAGGNLVGTNFTGSGTSFFVLGNTGTGSMVVSNAGVVSVNRLSLGHSASGSGSLLVTEGGRLEMAGVNYLRAGLFGGAGSVSNVDGGTIQFTIDNPDVAVGTGTGNGVVHNATIEYKDVAAADLNGNPYSFFSFSGTNTLRMINSSNAPVSSYSLQTNGSANFATLDLVDNSYFHSTNLFVGPAARILGDGTVDGNIATNQGTLSPGHSAGTLAFTGDLNLGSTSTLDLEIGGTASNQYDHLIVGGTLTRDGAFNLTFIDGYTPVGGEVFDLINAGTDLGAFVTTNLPSLVGKLEWDFSQFAADGILNVIKLVPEPSTIMLGITGLGIFAWWRRRRQG